MKRLVIDIVDEKAMQFIVDGKTVRMFIKADGTIRIATRDPALHLEGRAYMEGPFDTGIDIKIKDNKFNTRETYCDNCENLIDVDPFNTAVRCVSDDLRENLVFCTESCYDEYTEERQ